MSVISELLSKINLLSNDIVEAFNKQLKESFECLEKYEEEHNSKKQTREKTTKERTRLQSINEDDGENNKTPEDKPKSKTSIKTTDSTELIETQNTKPQKVTNKRSKNEVDDMSSPEQDKRQKRNASVVAKNNISKQGKQNSHLQNGNNVNVETTKIIVNVNLTQKLRRDEELPESKSRRQKDDNKENTEPTLLVQIKQEKVSISEPMDLESLPIEIDIKKEVNKDEIAMPPPAAPLPRTRKAIPKEKPQELVEEETGRRGTRTRKQTESLLSTSVASTRVTRGSSRATQQTETEEVPIKESRPKRTRGRKKVSDVNVEPVNETQNSQENGIGSPLADKPRPKRTRKGQKASEKVVPKDEPVTTQEVSPKEEQASQSIITSPILQIKTRHNVKARPIVAASEPLPESEKLAKTIEIEAQTLNTNKQADEINSETTEVTDGPKLNCTVTLDKTVVLPNGVYDHAPVTPKNKRIMNETVVIEKQGVNNETVVLDRPAFPMDATMVLDKPTTVGMEATILLERLPPENNVTDDNSLITNDSDTADAQTPPKPIPAKQPPSAVKEKVQQFEELAAKTTRTKTRAMAQNASEENHTPPDKVSKAILSAETLSKMNNMIFNGKTQQLSNSATKPKSNISTMKSFSSSTSKLIGINKAREAAEELQKKEKEDARSKKEAILEAKKEAQRKKREDKMAAAAAAREMAEKERRAAMEAATRERMEKQAQADLGKLEKLKEVERKKQEQARKAAETEERRKAEEQARAQRLAEEQKRAEVARKKQLEEAEALRKEEAQMAKEVMQKQKEYYEKQKLKSKMDSHRTTPLKAYGHTYTVDPVYMADGFQYLRSDEEEEVERPPPEWCSHSQRRKDLSRQARQHDVDIEQLFYMGPQCPDLRLIFPNIERARLKRTSSAVWRTPPPDSRYKPK